MNTITMICPECRNPFVDDLFYCQHCGIEFPIADGIACFADTDGFYKGRFSSTTPIVSSAARNRFSRILYKIYILLSASERVRAFYQKVIPEDSSQKILDVGCGGGDEFIASRGYTVGVDLSRDSLEKAAMIYDEVYSCDAAKLPFADCSFDMVISSNFFGHICPSEKDGIIAEMIRVLQPGGLMVHNVETHAHNSFIRFLHTSPEIFRVEVIERHGHYGLELPTHLIRRFEYLGLEIVNVKKHFGNIGSVDFYDLHKYADNRVWPAFVSNIYRWVVKKPIRKAVANVILGALVALECRLISLDSAQGIIICLRTSTSNS